MSEFLIKEWHVILIFVTIIGGILKDDFIATINSFSSARVYKQLKNTKAWLLSENRVWEEIEIIDYQYQIPFVQSGGLTILHKNIKTGLLCTEFFTFDKWQSQRFRLEQ